MIAEVVALICRCRHADWQHEAGRCQAKVGRGICRCRQFHPRDESVELPAAAAVPKPHTNGLGLAVVPLPAAAPTASISFICGLCRFHWIMLLPGEIPLDKYGRIMRAFDVIGCPACRADGFNITVREEKGVSNGNSRDGQT